MRHGFAMMARYNRWANRRLYAAAAALPDEDYRADTGAFFRSLHGTLNHLLVTDRIWLWRLTGSGDHPDRLDAILFDQLPQLSKARETEDERIVRYVDGLPDDAFAADRSYRSMSGSPHAQPLSQILAHVFNHQTHHRGQAHAILTRLAGDAPSFDMIVFQRENAAQA